MGSATWAAALVIAASAGMASFAEASILPQIELARKIQEARETVDAAAPPALREHYVEIQPGVYTAVKGSRERRQVRFARLIESLDGDRLDVYRREGFPSFRHRENDGGVRTTHWTYLGSNVTYVFRGNDLIRTAPF